jgi:hypothetical protein
MGTLLESSSLGKDFDSSTGSDGSVASSSSVGGVGIGTFQSTTAQPARNRTFGSFDGSTEYSSYW